MRAGVQVAEQYKEKILSGDLVQNQLVNEQTAADAVKLAESVAKSELETIRILFADQHGILRGKTVVASAFPSVLANGLGVPGTLLLKDTSHRTSFPVWTDTTSEHTGPPAGASDVLLVPEPATFRELPWTNKSAWIFCTPVLKSGATIDFAPRTVLQKSVDALAKQNLQLIVGLEVEFHVFELLDAHREHADTSMPGKAPLTRSLAQGYQFLTETRYADLEPVMDDLRHHCEHLNLPIRSMEVEMGPSQFEFTFEPSDPISHADNMMMFRTMVKEVCSRQGLHASFMCRPKLENIASNGWHLHQSLINVADGNNLMMPHASGELSPSAGHWIAGLLAHAKESCLLTTPTVNGYKRYQPYQLAPDSIQWGRDNRGAMIRDLTRPGDTASRIENRVAETAANPYYFFASQILSGLSGIEQKLAPPAAIEKPYDNTCESLPCSLIEAIELFSSSSLYRNALGDGFVDYLVTLKNAEGKRYSMTVSDWEHCEYFSLF